MPIYCFKHPKTGEVFEELRLMKDIDKPFFAEDGIECPRIVPDHVSGWVEGREVFQCVYLQSS